MRNPLLNIPIARRLAFGFLIPALIVSIALGSTGIQSRQLLTQESMFYQGLIHTYSSLTTATGYLAQVDTIMQATVSDASSASTTPETLTEDRTAFRALAQDYGVIIENDIQHDVLDQHTDLSALFTEAGHYAQIGEQRSLLAYTQDTWLAYFSVQKQVLTTIDRGDITGASTLEYANAELKYAGALKALKTLIDFDAHLVSSVGDATNVEENYLLYTTILAALFVLLGIGIVGWLVSSTMVRRLQQLRSMVQAIGKGQVNTRLT